MLLDIDVQRGKDQKLFDGKSDYDYTCWIDSDTIFSPTQFQKLLNHNVDIVSALQGFHGGNGFTCGYLNEDYFRKNGYMKYLTQETIEKVEKNEHGAYSC
jgi:hypothetical protein